jgi:hypothetical protein
MMLEPAEYPQLIITHMDDSETVIHLTDADAYTWLPTTGGLMVRRVTGRTVFPWQTVKCYTIVPIAGKYLPSDLPDFDDTVMGNTECAMDYASIVDELRRTARGTDAYPRNAVRCDHNVEPGFHCTMCHGATKDVDSIEDPATRWAARRGHDTADWTGPTHWTRTALNYRLLRGPMGHRKT